MTGWFFIAAMARSTRVWGESLAIETSCRSAVNGPAQVHPPMPLERRDGVAFEATHASMRAGSGRSDLSSFIEVRSPDGQGKEVSNVGD